MDKERVQRFSNLLLVRKLECAFEWNPAVCQWTEMHEELHSNSPNTFKVHRTNLDDMSGFLALQDTIPATSRHTGYVE